MKQHKQINKLFQNLEAKIYPQLTPKLDHDIHSKINYNSLDTIDKTKNSLEAHLVEKKYFKEILPEIDPRFVVNPSPYTYNWWNNSPGIGSWLPSSGDSFFGVDRFGCRYVSPDNKKRAFEFSIKWDTQKWDTQMIALRNIYSGSYFIAPQIILPKAQYDQLAADLQDTSVYGGINPGEQIIDEDQTD